MQRQVVDTNYLTYPGLETWLAASPKHYALISQVTMIEIHKEYAASNARRLMQIACRYPAQIKILRDLTDLTYMTGATRRLTRRMVDEDQTKKFGAYCATVIEAPMDDAIARQFAFFEEQSRAYIAEVAVTAPYIFNLFRKAEGAFTCSDVRHLCQRRSYPPDLQEKMVQLAFAIRELLIREQRDRFTRDLREAINTYLFRYSLAVALFFARWIKTGRMDISNEGKLVNQILDMKIAAVATFYDGLLTREAKMAEMHQEAVFVASGLGGYVRCGKGLRRDECGPLA